jgi:hypothetical protein
VGIVDYSPQSKTLASDCFSIIPEIDDKAAFILPLTEKGHVNRLLHCLIFPDKVPPQKISTALLGQSLTLT